MSPKSEEGSKVAETADATAQQAAKHGLKTLAFTGDKNLDELKAYIKEAIEKSDKRLFDPLDPKLEQATRRALIVAVTYPGNARLHLPQSLQDACIIHELLVERYGYQPDHIRIITDAVPDEEYTSAIQSTRNNILNGLDWLVHNTRATDRRFFHFSGHGHSDLSEPGRGKIMKHRVQAGVGAVGDTELLLTENEADVSERILEQSSRPEELGEYYEAILTWPIEQNGNKIKDHELNLKLAGLVPGCRLISVLDCCYSGRLLDNPIKGYGRGFINIGTPSYAQTPIVLVELERPIPRFEGLPPNELARDRIRAEAITWSACHQRQSSANSFRTGAGLLTMFFAQLLSSGEPESPIIESFTHILSENVRLECRGHNPQYVQLRMSLADASKAHETEVLNQPVALWFGLSD